MTRAFKSLRNVAAFFFVAALAYMAGLRQNRPATGAAPKTYEVTLGSLHLRLSAGALGIGVILALAILLAATLALAALARRRRRRTEVAKRQLENEMRERRRTELALSESELLLQSVVNNSTAVIYVKDLEGRYVLVNRRYEELFHIPKARVVGKTDYDFFPKDQADAFRAVDRRAAESASVVEAEETARLEDGVHTYLSIKFPLCDTDGRPYAIGGISTDITERKAAAEAIRESREWYRTLAESLPGLIWTSDKDGDWDYVSGQWTEYTGRRADAHLGEGWLECLHPEDRARALGAWREAAAWGGAFACECRIRRSDGVYRWFQTRAVPLRNAAGQIVKWFGSNTDFEDHKAAQQKLHAQLVRLALLDQITRAIAERQDLQSIFQVVIRTLEDGLPIDFGCVCLYDPEADALTVTSAGMRDAALARELAGEGRIGAGSNGLARCVRGQLIYEPDIGNLAWPFAASLSDAGYRALVAAPLLVESKVFGVLVAARRETYSFSSGDCEFLRQLSQHVALAAHQAQIYADLQRAYDDLRQTQQVVMQQERLGALGQMASGIAHDINNALSPMVLYTEALLEREEGLSARARGYLETMQRALDDVSHTVARMREFYRQRERQVELAGVRLNDLVPQVADLTRARWSDLPQQRGVEIVLRQELMADLPDVAGIESEIREALVNLIFNAVDAMPEGGTLTVRTGVSGEPGLVYVEVQDTGCGMDEGTRARCLEPFFTTKGERGTGLGLAMVFGIARRHNAEIGIESALGEGTTMRLSFAAMAAPETAEHARHPAAPSRLRILVVDDDPLIIKSLCDALENDGHCVTAAHGGQEGIDTFEASQGAEVFAVVITDLGMPRVDGRKVASAVKRTSAETPVILLTGWGQRLAAEGDAPPCVDRVLNKPPKLRELRAALAELTG